MRRTDMVNLSRDLSLLILLLMLAGSRAFVPAIAASGRASLLVRGHTSSTTISNSVSATRQYTTRSSIMCSLGKLFGGGSSKTAMSSIFDFKVEDATASEVDLSQYRGTKKAFLIVNVASLTAQNYAELAVLYERHSSRGLEILGFPCNQFGSQEPGTNAEIQQFAKARGATYPIFAKIDVNGFGASPLYKFLKDKQGGGLGISAIKWNFTKFLCDADGVPIKRFGPTDSPLSFEQDIVALLK